eukprot:10226117-Ditylum_brightwellii.AAC.1
MSSHDSDDKGNLLVCGKSNGELQLIQFHDAGYGGMNSAAAFQWKEYNFGCIDKTGATDKQPNAVSTAWTYYYCIQCYNY